jgi:hypothetical protein
MARYIQTGELDVVDEKARSQFSDLVRGAQRKIMSSSAITPTTNIADVNHLSQNIFKYLTDTEAGNQGVQIRAAAGELEIAGLDAETTGVLQYDKKNRKFVFSYGRGLEENVETQKAQSAITKKLNEARKVPEDDITLGKLGKKIKFNKASNDIIDLGINYMQAHQINEVYNMRSALAGQAKNLDAEVLLENLGKTYKLFGSDISISDQVAIAKGGSTKTSVFSVGFRNYDEKAAKEIALASQSMGSPYASLDVRSRILSTILSESTVQTAKDAQNNLQQLMRQDGLSEGQLEAYQKQLDSIKYAKHAELLSEFGVTHFKGQSEFRMFMNDDQVARRIFAPLDLMQEAAGEFFAGGSVSLSYVDESSQMGPRINAFFHLKKGSSKEDAKRLVGNLFELAEKADTKDAKVKELDEIGKFKVAIQGALKRKGGVKDSLIEEIAERLLEDGIGIGFIEGEDATRIFDSFHKVGVDLSNDVVLRSSRMKIIDTINGFLRTGPIEDTVVEEATAVAKESGMATAQGSQEQGDSLIRILNEASEKIDESGTARKIQSNINRAKIGMGKNPLIDFYIQNKFKLGTVGLGLAAAGTVYYLSKKYRENRLYDETLAQQPTQKAGQIRSEINNNFAETKVSSFRRDPLTTAGVVGNLHNNRTNHYRMGNQKYDYLYGGQI